MGLSVASLAIIAHLEEARLRVLGAAWRPPVIHGNDAQTAMVNVLVSEAVAGGNPRAEALAKNLEIDGIVMGERSMLEGYLSSYVLRLKGSPLVKEATVQKSVVEALQH